MLLFIFCGEDASEETPVEETIESTDEYRRKRKLQCCN